MPRTVQRNFVEFGRRLRRTREARNLSIPLLSELTGISTHALYNYEAGRRMPSPLGPDSEGAKLCTVLRINMNWLYRADTNWMDLELVNALRAHQLDSFDEPALAKGQKRRRRPMDLELAAARLTNQLDEPALAKGQKPRRRPAR
jgi:transcriptional regulator with XRE-family HTH domain